MKIYSKACVKILSKKLPTFEFKIDNYTRKRGAPAMLIISCLNCAEFLMSYQKDGPGPLLRCYLDRICYPENPKQLECTSCQEVIGDPIIYQKENRPAYLMRKDTFAIDKFNME